MVENNLSKLKGLKGVSIEYNETDWAPLVGSDLEQMVAFLPLLTKMKGIFKGEVSATEQDVKELVSVSASFRALIRNVMKRTYTFDNLYKNGEFPDDQPRKDSLLEYNQLIADVGLKHIIGLGLAIIDHIPVLLEGLPLLDDEEGDNEGDGGEGEDPQKGTL